MKIDPFETPGLLPAERLVLAVLMADPSANHHRVVDRTGMESAVVARTIKELRKRKLLPRAGK